MRIQFIDRRCTVDVHPTSRGCFFEYGGKTHRRKTVEGVHNFFLKEYRSEKLDTVKLHLNQEKYYLHFTLDEPEKFTSKRALRSVLAQENGGTWIEEKNGRQRYFMEEGWLFSRVREVSEEEFFAPKTSDLMQKVATLVLGALSIGSSLVHTARRMPATSDASLIISHLSPGLGLVGFSLWHASPVLAQMPAFGEFRINANTTKLGTHPTTQDGQFSRSFPKLTGLLGGGFVAAWQSHDQDGSGWGVYGQRYDAAGFPLGSEFLINTNTTGDQQHPTLAGLMDGGFVAAWISEYAVDSDIYGQMYNASGAPVGPEFLINTNTTNFQETPTLAGLTDGGFIAAWAGAQTGNDDIYCQRYNALGAPVGSEFRINTNTTGDQQNPTLAGLMDGGFVAAWAGDQTGIFFDIYGQRYNASGTPVGSEFLINTNTTSYQEIPTLASLKDGGFVAAWQGYQTGDDNIYGQRYNVSGIPVGSEFQINTNTTSGQYGPTLADLTDGGFVAAWYGDQTGNYGIYGQRYNALGAPVGFEFPINTNTTGYQANPTLVGLSDGGFVAAWQGDQTGYSQIYGQRYDANGSAVAPLPLPSPQPSPNSLALPFSVPISKAPASTAPSPSQGSSSPPGSSIAQTIPQPIPAPNPSPSSNTRSPVSAGSNSVQSSPTSGLISITTVSYGIAYAIYVNGVSVGTFEITGGTGLVSGNLSNTLTIHLDASTDLGQGPISLFTFSSSQGNFQSLVITGDGSTSCRVPEGTIVQDSSGQSTYQAIYTTKTCTTAAAARPASAFFPMTMLKV